MVHAKFIAEGALEKPDVIGAVFGQTEGLLGNELEMRELQKEGKIGRIEVDMERKGKKIEFKLIDTPGIATKVDFEDFLKFGLSKKEAQKSNPIGL